MCFLLFYSFTCDFLEFPSVKSSEIFTAHRIMRDTNFKDENSGVCIGSFFDFCKFVFYRCKKTGLTRISLKTSSDLLVKYLLPVCQILRNFTEDNARKFTDSFAFCAHVDVIR